MVADIEGDGSTEIVIGGNKALLWYKPQTFEKGIVGNGAFHVGLIAEDLVKDGIRHVIAGEQNPQTEKWMITWYKGPKDVRQSWSRYVIDEDCLAGAHCLAFADLDGDGEKEIIANATYNPVWGLFAYKKPASVTQPWEKHTIQTGFSEEGLAVTDLNGDQKLDIVSGVAWYEPPTSGTFSGTWTRHVYAPNFREMVRVALADVNADGRTDIVTVESEFPDGLMSWFENRIGQDARNPWLEHPLFSGLNFAHSFAAYKDQASNHLRVFVAEMMKGGWNAPYNFDARLLEFTNADRGQSWRQELLYQGAGTHQAVQYDIDGDG